MTKRFHPHRVVPRPEAAGSDRPSRPAGPPEPDPLRVLVVDCDPMLGGELVAELARVDGRLLLVGWVAELEGAVALARLTDPDVVVAGKVAGAGLDAVASAMRDAASDALVVALVEPPGADLGAADGEPIAGFIARASSPRDTARSFFEIARLALASSGRGTG